MSVALVLAGLFVAVVALTVWALEQHEGEDLSDPDDDAADSARSLSAIDPYLDRSP